MRLFGINAKYLYQWSLFVVVFGLGVTKVAFAGPAKPKDILPKALTTVTALSMNKTLQPTARRFFKTTIALFKEIQRSSPVSKNRISGLTRLYCDRLQDSQILVTQTENTRAANYQLVTLKSRKFKTQYRGIGILPWSDERTNTIVKESEAVREACAGDDLENLRHKLSVMYIDIEENVLSETIIRHANISAPFINTKKRFNDEFKKGCADEAHIEGTCPEETLEYFGRLPVETSTQLLGIDVDAGGSR